MHEQRTYSMISGSMDQSKSKPFWSPRMSMLIGAWFLSHCSQYKDLRMLGTRGLAESLELPICWWGKVLGPAFVRVTETAVAMEPIEHLQHCGWSVVVPGFVDNPVHWNPSVVLMRDTLIGTHPIYTKQIDHGSIMFSLRIPEGRSEASVMQLEQG